MEVILTLEEQFQDFAIDDEERCSFEEFTTTEVNFEKMNTLAEECQ